MAIDLPAEDSVYAGRIGEYPALLEAWRYSSQRLIAASDAIAHALAELPAANVAVFLAGSYGRMDACPSSDGDLLVVYEGEMQPKVATTLFSSILEALKALEFGGANPRGAFNGPFSLDSLTTGLHGGEEETSTLTRRMLLLMEARCVFNPLIGVRAIDYLLEFYFQYHDDAPSRELVILMNDTIRYFRQICVDYQWWFPVDTDKWALRNVKLRHSRLMIYLGLLLPCLHSSDARYRASRRAYLDSLLGQPPLARVYQVLTEAGYPAEAEAVLGHYDTFVAAMSRPEVRASLQVEYTERHVAEAYTMLKRNSDELKRVVTHVIYDIRKRGTWTDAAFEYLIL